MKSIRAIIKSHRLKELERQWELVGPAFIGELALIFAVLWHVVLKKPIPIPEDPKTILTTTITVSSIAIGFIATAKSIFISMSESSPAKKLKENDLFQDVISFCLEAMRGLLFFVGLSTLGLFIPSKHDPQLLISIYCIAWFVTVCYALALTIRAILVYENFTKALAKK